MQLRSFRARQPAAHAHSHRDWLALGGMVVVVRIEGVTVGNGAPGRTVRDASSQSSRGKNGHRVTASAPEPRLAGQQSQRLVVFTERLLL